jgi:hypothetical protein
MSPIHRLQRRFIFLACASVALGLVLVQTRRYYANFSHKVSHSPGATAVALLLLVFVSLYRTLLTKSNPSAFPPRVRGWLPGNIDILWQLVKDESREYCASTLRQWEQTYGPTYDMNILWSHQACLVLLRFVLAAKFKTFVAIITPRL